MRKVRAIQIRKMAKQLWSTMLAAKKKTWQFLWAYGGRDRKTKMIKRTAKPCFVAGKGFKRFYRWMKKHYVEAAVRTR